MVQGFGPTSGTPPAVLGSWNASIPGYSSEDLGGKAIGLFRVPAPWKPPFVVLTSKFVDIARKIGVANAYDQLAADQRGLVVELIDLAQNSGRSAGLFPGLFVRSNAVEEGGSSARGRYSSTAVDPNIEATVPVIEDLLGKSSRMRVILQIAINGINGFLSNERRVVERRDHGLVEGLPGGPSKQRMIRSKPPDEIAPLMATNVKDAEACLRNVLGWVNANLAGFGNVEWIWDGNRIWVVQLDELKQEASDPAAEHYLRATARPYRSERRSIEGAQYFLEADSERWKKLWRAALFSRLGMPTADIYLIVGSQWSPVAAPGLVEQLFAAASGEWVVRTDVATSSEFSPDLLPTSHPTDNANEIVAFMADTAAKFEMHKLARDEWAFIAAPFVPARVSAMAYAHPGGSDVQVDALWGFPDGLMYLPHDTYYYIPGKPVSVEKRYKPACYLFSDKKWRTMRIGATLDREQTLNSAEVITIATWARHVADELGKPVILMALARISGRRGENGCLPFHFTTGEVAKPAFNIDLPENGIITVRSLEDIDSVANSPAVLGVAIEPRIELARDAIFLDQLARIATERGIPILFEGSLLAHAYHIMRSAGATVVPMYPTSFPGTLITYQKLVRDAIPAIIERAGAVARIRTLTPAEAVPLLKRKLVEEALEVLETVTDRQLVEELADVAEVLEALEKHVDGGHESVLEVMLAKRQKRGGFQDLVFLEATDSQPVGAYPDMVSRAKTREDTTIHIRSEKPEPGSTGSIEFNVPLIPPVAATVLRGRIALTPNQDVRVEIHYSAATASVEIDIVEHTDQPSLFDTSTIDPSRGQP